MVETASPPVTELPLAPRNPLPYREQVRCLRSFIDGMQRLRDAGGPVTRIVLGPRWLVPPALLVTSPQGAHDVLSLPDAVADRGGSRNMRQLQLLMGGNLLDLPHDRWLPRRRTLQPLFTKKHVPRFAGHMAAAAQSVADSWRDGTTVDLDTACRALTLRALGRSVFGVDLDQRAEDVSPALRTSLSWVSDRTVRPVNLPQWVPTPAQHKARAGNATLHRLAAEILAGVRADPERDAPLVRALLEARDPETGRALTDAEICDELVLFVLAGHDTTSTTLCYSLWALGHHPDIQERVYAEVATLGDRELTTDDVPQLTYTVRVLHEALRLCPPGAATTRMLNQDVVVDGYRATAGTMAIVNFYVMHRNPALWDAPERFDPDRFSPERSAGRNRWQYLPFGGGPRSCIGDHFAMLEATLALATVIRAVSVESQNTDFPVETPFTVIAAAPVPARVTRR